MTFSPSEVDWFDFFVLIYKKSYKKDLSREEFEKLTKKERYKILA